MTQRFIVLSAVRKTRIPIPPTGWDGLLELRLLFRSAYLLITHQALGYLVISLIMA